MVSLYQNERERKLPLGCGNPFTLRYLELAHVEVASAGIRILKRTPFRPWRYLVEFVFRIPWLSPLRYL